MTGFIMTSQKQSRGFMKSSLFRICFSLAATTLGMGRIWAQDEAAVLGNPFNTPADVEAGRVLYASECAGCHGRDGEGGRGPALDRGRFRHANNDQELYKLISSGVPGTEMPAFSFNGKQMWQTIAFVRSIGASKAGKLADGDRVKGEELFFGKGSCTTCHRIHGRGSRSGPDLSRIGPQRSVGQLEAALMRPNTVTFPENQQIRVTLRNGDHILGRRLNEDTFSLQLLTTNDKLTSLRKQDITGYQIVASSSMPSYEGRLSETELRNLIAYLASLSR